MIKMKPAIPYYGGKSKLASKIIPLFPPHVCYAEPFAGGAAILFAKEPSEVEVINDTNKEIINFYPVVKNNFTDLEKMIRVTLHSRTMYQDASTVYNSPHLFDEIKRAWAVWVLAVQSFASMLDGTFGFDKKSGTTSQKVNNKRENFTEEYAIRLQSTQIECVDALYIIQSRDTPDTFFYCDPPYYNSDCGPYAGYSMEDFERLLKALAAAKGKFLLSSYPSDLLASYVKLYGWHQRQFEQAVSVNKGYGGKKKIEVLTANYPI